MHLVGLIKITLAKHKAITITIQINHIHTRKLTKYISICYWYQLTGITCSLVKTAPHRVPTIIRRNVGDFKSSTHAGGSLEGVMFQ